MIFDIIKLLINPPTINPDIYVTQEGGFGLKSRPLKDRYLKMCKEFERLDIKKYIEK